MRSFVFSVALLLAAGCDRGAPRSLADAGPGLDSRAVLSDADRTDVELERADALGVDAGLGSADADAEARTDAADATASDTDTVDDATADATDADAADADAADADQADTGGTGPDATTAAPHYGWAQYTLAPGSHSASLAQNGAPRLPLAGLVRVSARSYDFIFDLSARYLLTSPAQPDDQLDWNKLPGLSDCGQVDLAQDGLMFAWRWRPDLTPAVLEIAHYANNGATHLYPSAGLITLDEADLAAETPLRYELTITSTAYRFHLSGTIRGRAIDERASFPRRCSGSTSGLKWAAGLYFGGTSTAPQEIRGWVLE